MAYEGIKTQMFRQTITQTSTEQKEALGTLRILDDGRKFRYCKNGADALRAGVVVMPLALVANHTAEDLAAAVKVGDKKITITLGDTAVDANVYAGGYVQFHNTAVDGGGDGHQYKIATHPAAIAQASLTLQLDEPIVHNTVAAGTTLSLVHNRFKDVAVTDGVEAAVSGVTVCQVAANAYFWAQVSGDGLALGNATTAAAGEMISCAASGAVQKANASTGDSTIMGFARGATVNGNHTPIVLTLE